MSNVYHIFFTAVLMVIGVLLIACLVRAIRGPRIADRVIAANMMGTLIVITICILSFVMNEGYLVDIALIYVMLSFLAVVLLTKIYMGVYREKSFVLPLAQGWNLISVPCHLSDESANALLKREMFEMTSDGSYVRPTELREHGAYWLYVGADEDLTLTLTGASVTSAPEPGKGWTMQGLPSGASLSGEEVWQFRKGRWERAAETAVQGCGYVIHR